MKKANNDWKRTSVLLTQEQWKAIKKISRTVGIKKSELIRNIIEVYLNGDNRL